MKDVLWTSCQLGNSWTPGDEVEIVCVRHAQRMRMNHRTELRAYLRLHNATVMDSVCCWGPGQGWHSPAPAEALAEPSVLTLSPGLSPRMPGPLAQQWENPGPHAPPQKDWNILRRCVCFKPAIFKNAFKKWRLSVPSLNFKAETLNTWTQERQRGQVRGRGTLDLWFSQTLKSLRLAILQIRKDLTLVGLLEIWQ